MTPVLDLFGNRLQVTPPLKWAGGKRELVPVLSSYWQPHRRLIEPFVGGMSVALGLSPDRAVLNDANVHLINFYRHVQQGFSINIEMKNDETLFAQHRDRFNALSGYGAEAASLFYYLNRTCFNGLCRLNQAGKFNVGFGSYKTITYTRDFSAYIEPLKPYTFTSEDFASVPITTDDFVYADPPYDGGFTDYTAKGFTWGDQVRVAEWFSLHCGPVIVSNAATERIINLYTRLGYALKYVDASRRISCDGDREPAREVLAMRNMS